MNRMSSTWLAAVLALAESVFHTPKEKPKRKKKREKSVKIIRRRKKRQRRMPK